MDEVRFAVDRCVALVAIGARFFHFCRDENNGTHFIHALSPV